MADEQRHPRRFGRIHQRARRLDRVGDGLLDQQRHAARDARESRGTCSVLGVAMMTPSGFTSSSICS
jgi:hypothetical protein